MEAYQVSFTKRGHSEPIRKTIGGQGKAVYFFVRNLIDEGEKPETIESCFDARSTSKAFFLESEGILMDEQKKRYLWGTLFRFNDSTYYVSNQWTGSFWEKQKRLLPLFEKFPDYEMTCKIVGEAEDLHSQVVEELREAEQSGNPFSGSDQRRRSLQAIVIRGGSAKFRAEMLAEFGKCAVTGVDCSQALQAAHINGYLGDYTDTPDNGLLLRADIHLLFDRGLLAFAYQDGCVKTIIHPSIQATSYKSFHHATAEMGVQIASSKVRLHRLKDHRFKFGF